MNLADAGREIKEKLSGDEKVLESVFKLETIYGKHKFKIWGIAIALVVFFVGSAIQESMHEAKLVKANEAFLILQTKGDDADALQTLKDNNPALYELFSYAQATQKQDIKILESLSASQNMVIADASAYATGVLNRKPVYSALYHELSLFQEAYLAIKAGDTKIAQAKLDEIDERSPLAVISGFLKHSIIKAN